MMRQKLLQWTLMLAAIGFSACNEDEKLKTIPEVTTSAVTDVTTTSAMVGGEVISDGNASVITFGIVYSSVSSEPTIVDDKIELTDTEDNFNALLEGLSSGTLYHVRAYATNSLGTGYGEVVDFMTGNAGPVATGVTFTGDLEVNNELTASYTYEDAEDDVQSGTTFQWYMASDASGVGVTAITGATESTYVIQEAQRDKYISVGVTPKAATGAATGLEVKSVFKGAVGEATTVTFTYNGQEVTYGIIYREATGKKWLDRNLGAPNVPTAFNDFANAGDLFQWGRDDDGHQVINRTGPNNAGMSLVNGTTSAVPPYQYSASDNPGHSKFIIVENAPPFDWREPRNDNLWQGVNGINNPCPSGWRIPTEAEWAAENLGTLTEAFNNLNITTTGGCSGAEGAAFFQSDKGVYWSSTIKLVPAGSQGPYPTFAYSRRLEVVNSGSSMINGGHVGGNACRCIKD